jgi:hypothetical protein
MSFITFGSVVPPDLLETMDRVCYRTISVLEKWLRS